MTPFNAFHGSFALPHRSMPLSIIFVCFTQRYLVSKSHGSEAFNCYVQRFVFFSLMLCLSRQDPDRGFAAHNLSFGPEKALWHPGYLLRVRFV